MLYDAFTQPWRVIANLKAKFFFYVPYWVEIKTQQPKCLYYFGPFSSRSEAHKRQHGYVEDLIAEKAIGISVEIKRCLPTRLTIDDEE